MLVWIIDIYIILTDKYTVISCRIACSISIFHLSGIPHTLPEVINYTLHLSDKITDPVDLLSAKILLL
jgi:hypothetical protein